MRRPDIKENTVCVVAACQNSCYVCDSKSSAMMFWHVMSMKLNIAKKIAGLEIMTLNCENMYYVSNLLELMSKGKLHCLQGCFRKQTGREDI